MNEGSLRSATDDREGQIEHATSIFLRLLAKLSRDIGNTSWPEEFKRAHDRIVEAGMWAKRALR